jgi:hypothetical protein
MQKDCGGGINERDDPNAEGEGMSILELRSEACSSTTATAFAIGTIVIAYINAPIACLGYFTKAQSPTTFWCCTIAIRQRASTPTISISARRKTTWTTKWRGTGTLLLKGKIMDVQS